MQFTEPHPWILMLQVPVSPTGIHPVLLHAGSASFQGVIGAKSAGQKAQSVFQMRHRLATHHLCAVSNQTLRRKRSVVGQKGSVECKLVWRS